MPRRAPFTWDYPTNDVTAGVWLYLRGRFSSAGARDRREALGLAIERLAPDTAGGAPALHDAILHSVRLLLQHKRSVRDRQHLTVEAKPRQKKRKKIDEVIALVPAVLEMDALLARRDVFDTSDYPPPTHAGRDWAHWTYLESALRELGVARSEQVLIGQQLGFVPPDLPEDAPARKACRTK